MWSRFLSVGLVVGALIGAEMAFQNLWLTALVTGLVAATLPRAAPSSKRKQDTTHLHEIVFAPCTKGSAWRGRPQQPRALARRA